MWIILRELGGLDAASGAFLHFGHLLQDYLCKVIDGVFICGSLRSGDQEEVRRREEEEKKRAGQKKEEHSHRNFTRKILQIRLPAKPTNNIPRKLLCDNPDSMP